MIKEVKQIVTNILKEDIRTRDNDDILLATVWWKQIGTEIEKLSAVDFLKRFSRGEFPKPEGITRCRRKIQEMNPDLRGHEYEKRKKSITESVKKEVREMEVDR
tara:strand:- start:21 stop:332 length:312 start_codon:yes stop_codon:yes gene_type:complete